MLDGLKESKRRALFEKHKNDCNCSLNRAHVFVTEVLVVLLGQNNETDDGPVPNHRHGEETRSKRGEACFFCPDFSRSTMLCSNCETGSTRAAEAKSSSEIRVGNEWLPCSGDSSKAA